MLKWLRANKKLWYWSSALAKELKTKTFNQIKVRGYNLKYYEKKAIKLTPVQEKIKQLLLERPTYVN